MLRWRLLLGALFIAALVGLCWLDCRATIPGVWLAPVAVAVAVLASQEIVSLLRAGGLQPAAAVVYAGNLLLLAVNWAPWWMPARGRLAELRPAEWFVASLSLVALAAFASAMRRYEKPGGSVANTAATCFAVLYVGLMLALLVQVRIVWGIGALATLLLVVKMGDIGAYTVGRLIGRHKMAPRLSPGKTIEGACGALAFSAFAAWAAFGWLLPPPAVGQSGPGLCCGWLIFGLLVGGVGIAGDLAESLIKRDVGRKDSSVWLPGFGGVLDLVDSVLLAAPAAWLCWRLGLV